MKKVLNLLKYSCCVFCFICFTVCGQSQPKIPELKQKFDKVKSNELLVRRIDFNYDKIKKGKELILTNNIYLFDLWKPVKYHKIDWSINPYDNKSWYLYYQSLRMIGYLARDYEFSHDKLCIKKATDLITSWYNSYKNDFNKIKTKRLNKSVWNDHAVANRSLNLMHCLFVFPDDWELNELVKEMLYYHALWLNLDKNYTSGNHAIMMDRALFQISSFFEFEESEAFRNNALIRLNKIFEVEITKEGVCTENSSGYHTYVLDLLINAINLIDSFNFDVNQNWLEKRDLMLSFSNNMVQPNNCLVPIGDTYYSVYPKKFSKVYKDDRFIFNESYSLKGTYPQKNKFFYPESGYVFFNEKNYESTRDSVFHRNKFFMSFFNSNLSKVHKHNDYGSITLFNNNEPIFIDTGHLGYEKNDLTEYTRTNRAHNVLIVNNHEINFKKDKIQTKIYDCSHNENFSSFKGSIILNDEIKIKRNVLFIEPKTLVLIDEAESFNNKSSMITIEQIFNLGSGFINFELKSTEQDVLNFKNNKVVINQLLKANFKEYNSSLKNKKYRGMRAKGYNKPTDGKQITYSSQGLGSAKLITVISCNSVYDHKISVDRSNGLINFIDSRGESVSFEFETD